MQSAQATSNSMGTSRSWRLWSRPSIPSSSGSASWSRDMIGAGRPARDARSATRRTGIADFRRTCAATVLASGFAVGPPAQAADDWEFAIAPYLLAPNINGEAGLGRSEEHTSELQSLMRISYAVFCLKKKTITNTVLTNRSHVNNTT